MGGIKAFNQFPEQLAKVQANNDLIGNMVSEIIRWQSPVGHMCRTAMEDVEIGGKNIKNGIRLQSGTHLQIEI